MSGNFPPPSGDFSFTSEYQGSTNDEDTESLTESIIGVQEENGRTYHSYQAGSYPYPNDEREKERLELQYECISVLFGGRLFFAPWSRQHYPGTILDIGTGTGRWAIEMGDKFPLSTIRATDLSPIQTTHVPPNVNFCIEDGSLPWHPSLFYDYVHTRMTVGCWSDFCTDVCTQAYAQLNPGGWFESQELDPWVYCDDGTMPDSFQPLVWVQEMSEIADEAQRPVLMAQTARQSYEQAGFQNVRELAFRIPLNDWGGGGNLTRLERRVGRMWEENMLEGLSAMSLGLYTRYRNMNQKRVEGRLLHVRRGLRDKNVHAYMRIVVVLGQKPTSPDRGVTGPSLQMT
ncbi:uncharacterized protein MKZ38_004176 [Zalerion maritima]|uniref:S-adenosyl-L-methionine-dependent methyltransferase n=1 Tax=Zalerion maritima TaxID=339359 RepID=A0AAD5WPR4_9PEZI|nr:uncharacterized protein MKZ38_004176 [Zalerion maritima]